MQMVPREYMPEQYTLPIGASACSMEKSKTAAKNVVGLSILFSSSKNSFLLLRICSTLGKLLSLDDVAPCQLALFVELKLIVLFKALRLRSTPVTRNTRIIEGQGLT